VTPRARKRFGQHFLEPAWVDKLVAAIDPVPADTFLEIGPGAGALTLALAPRVGRLLAIEIDRDLAPALARRVPPHVAIHRADFLDADVEGLLGETAPVRVAGNLPYNVSTPILARLLDLADDGRRFRDATVMLQLEVAQRLTARPGSKDWGVLGACQQLRADAAIVLALPPGAFRPAPKVRSAVVRLRYRPPAPAVVDLDLFESLVRSLFTQRRKMLSNAVAPFACARAADPGKALERAALDGRRRPETLSLAELGRLADVFASA
jgi:16S rRNA (adenine1518-N6/adenine1519-N6)-dimethyltransferase